MGINGNGKNGDPWLRTKEKVLLAAGIGAIAYETIVVGLLNQPFHPEVLVAGGTLCGLAITRWRNEK